VTDGTSSPLPQPGWYPDHAGGAGLRWWDGTQWTDHVSAPIAAQPYSPAGPQRNTAPATARVGNPFIWIYAFLPLAGIITLVSINWSELGRVVASSINTDGTTTSPGAIDMGSILTPGYLIGALLSWLAIAAAVVLAYFDWRTLRKTGVDRPFHWAFAFFAVMSLQIVYAIGRGVVTHRRSGRGFAPMWVFIAVQVIAWIVGIVCVSIYVSAIVGNLPDLSTTGSFS
jgi:hypothetical protein